MAPIDVINRFCQGIDRSLSHYDELKLAVYNKTNQDALKSRLAEQFARTITLDWETFVNDVFLAYLRSDPSYYFEDLRKRLVSNIRDKFGEAVLTRMHIDLRQPKEESEMAKLADPKGFNLTFRKSGDLSSKANLWLPAGTAIKFSLASDDADLFDFLVALRNHLSHQSAKSLADVKAHALNQANNAPFVLTAPFRLPSYLKATPVNQTEDRVKLLGLRIKSIAISLG